jgi:hypothetical protein
MITKGLLRYTELFDRSHDALFANLLIQLRCNEIPKVFYSQQEKQCISTGCRCVLTNPGLAQLVIAPD